MCYKYIISYYLFLFITVNLAWDLCAASFTNKFCSRLSFRNVQNKLREIQLIMLQQRIHC